MTTHLTNERSMRESEIPLSTTEAMLKQTIKTAKQMARGPPGQSAEMAKTTNASSQKLGTSSMTFPVMEFQDQGYKIRKIFA